MSSLAATAMVRPKIRRIDISLLYVVLTGMPFPDQFFDFVTAHDFLEHIPRLIYSPARRLPFVELMNEIWRVLKTLY